MGSMRWRMAPWPLANSLASMFNSMTLSDEDHVARTELAASHPGTAAPIAPGTASPFRTSTWASPYQP
jgi:hypothetical protein